MHARRGTHTKKKAFISQEIKVFLNFLQANKLMFTRLDTKLSI